MEAFIGADKAVIIDAKGQKHEVDCLLGANEIYDIVKFQVSGKTIAAPLATTVSVGDEAWITPMPRVVMLKRLMCQVLKNSWISIIIRF